MLQCRAEFWGRKLHATSTIEVQGGECGYGPGGFKNWWEGMACGTSRNEKSGGHQRREPQTKTKKKKKKKRKKKKVNLVVTGLDLTAFLIGPRGCPLDHWYGPNRAFHTNLNLLSIHMGSSSNIQPGKVTKKRVLQRVLRYYHGSTLPT